jgi:hypothetical protein
MTASVGDHQLSAAILSSICDGSFPDSEDVLTAELPATALPSILREVSEARQQLEVRQCIKNAGPCQADESFNSSTRSVASAETPQQMSIHGLHMRNDFMRKLQSLEV